MIYGIVLVKIVKIVFTLKQFNFSFPDQTAVCSNISISLSYVLVDKICKRESTPNLGSMYICPYIEAVARPDWPENDSGTLYPVYDQAAHNLWFGLLGRRFLLGSFFLGLDLPCFTSQGEREQTSDNSLHRLVNLYGNVWPVYGRKSADRTEHGNDVIFSVFLATVFGKLEVRKVRKWNIFLKYISAAV